METVIIGRYLFVFCLFLSWLNSTIHILQPKEMLYSRGIQKKWHGQEWKFLLPSSLVFLSSCFLFALEYWEFWSGLVILLEIFWIRRWEISLWRERIVVDLGKYSPSGSCLFFYLLGFLIAPLLKQEPQLVGLEAACGVTAAAWILAGWKKIELSGIHWMSSKTMG